MNRVIPSRITEAREARAMSMGDLANSIGITRQSISKFEKGIVAPSIETLQELSSKLCFPIEFFYKDELNNTVRSPLFFRSNSNIAKKIKNACIYQVKWTHEIKDQLGNYVDFVGLNIPSLEKDYDELTLADVEELALRVRECWGIGDDPIKDLIGILENNGIVVSQFATSDFCTFKGIDAFSAWEGGTPYIMYHKVQKSAVRTRFSILHELGHILMHSSISDEDSIKKNIVDFVDMQADRFAAAFLLPATSFPKDIHGSSLYALEMVKRKWGVAISTIIKRCDDLGILSENQINYLKRQMTLKKYWHKEPLDDVLYVQPPEMLRDAICLVIDSGIITKDSFINTSALSLEDLKSICALPDSFFVGCNSRQKPVLRLIKPSN